MCPGCLPSWPQLCCPNHPCHFGCLAPGLALCLAPAGWRVCVAPGWVLVNVGCPLPAARHLESPAARRLNEPAHGKLVLQCRNQGTSAGWHVFNSKHACMHATAAGTSYVGWLVSSAPKALCVRQCHLLWVVCGADRLNLRAVWQANGMRTVARRHTSSCGWFCTKVARVVRYSPSPSSSENCISQKESERACFELRAPPWTGCASAPLGAPGFGCDLENLHRQCCRPLQRAPSAGRELVCGHRC